MIQITYRMPNKSKEDNALKRPVSRPITEATLMVYKLMQDTNIIYNLYPRSKTYNVIVSKPVVYKIFDLE